MRIANYQAEYKEDWDAFVRQSKNSTFLLCRDFMEYHSDRFTDHSLLFYDKNKLLALLPANISHGVIHSHQGLTYGGLILSEGVKQKEVLKIFSELRVYLKRQAIDKIVYKPIPHIYHALPSEEDLYALFRNDAVLTARTVASTICNENKLGYAQLRKRQIKKASALGLEVSEQADFGEFWKILDENLRVKHNTRPVHTLEEIEYLKSKFPDEIRLFTASRNGDVVAGCLIFETPQVAHVQYISANEYGKAIGALDFLFDHLITSVFRDKKYFDFGTSTEDGGQHLNEGLIAQKEGFGGRAIVYDTYEINID